MFNEALWLVDIALKSFPRLCNSYCHSAQKFNEAMFSRLKKHVTSVGSYCINPGVKPIWLAFGSCTCSLGMLCPHWHVMPHMGMLCPTRACCAPHWHVMPHRGILLPLWLLIPLAMLLQILTHCYYRYAQSGIRFEINGAFSGCGVKSKNGVSVSFIGSLSIK